jgi:hypothetical protein
MSKKDKRQAGGADTAERPRPEEKLKRKDYETRLDELHMELVKMQY